MERLGAGMDKGPSPIGLACAMPKREGLILSGGRGGCPLTPEAERILAEME